MTLPGRPSRGRPEPEGHGATSAARGAILVGVAVLVGLLMFLVIDGASGGGGGSDTAPVTAPPAAVTTTPGATSATTAAGGTTVTTKKSKTTTTTAKATKGARPAAEVVVQVLNGSGIQGAATQRSNDLKAKGYQVLPAGNAPTTRTGTAVECHSGYEKDAVALSQTLQTLGVSAAVSPLPEPLPSGYEASANCYVILGK